MSTVRAFIAVEINSPLKRKISSLISTLKKSDAHIKWVTEGQMHLTLKFLGNIEQNKVKDISCVLKSIGDNFSNFTIRFSNIGIFPGLKKPRVIWLGIAEGAQPMKLLNNKIETELEKIGFKKEKREYKAHLTLGRVKSLRNIQSLIRIINGLDIHLDDEIKIDKIILFQSTLTPQGAHYTPLAKLPLRSM